jgi:hypothetical protein
MHTGPVHVSHFSGERRTGRRGGEKGEVKKEPELKGGGSSTAPEGAREGPASLFTVDRRKPFTQEPVGAPLRGCSARHCSEVVLSMWCITRHPANEGGARDPGSAREPAEPSSSRRGQGGGSGLMEVQMDPEHIASDVRHKIQKSGWGTAKSMATNGRMSRVICQKRHFPTLFRPGSRNFPALRFGYSVIFNQFSVDWRGAVGMCSVIRWPSRSTAGSFTPQQLPPPPPTAPTGWHGRGTCRAPS